MNFAMVHMADVTATNLLYDIETLFSPESKGQVFCMFRNPIERAVSLFNYLQYADWEPTYMKELKGMSLEEYARSEYMENNYITRVLSNTPEGDLTNDHFEIARYVLERKIIVGIKERLDESVTRFEQVFGWRYSFDPSEQEKCRQGYIEKGANTNRNENPVEVPPEGTPSYEALNWQLLYDIQIYKRAMELFEEQSALVADKRTDIRLVDATCSVCKEKQLARTQGDSFEFDLDANPEQIILGV